MLLLDAKTFLQNVQGKTMALIGERYEREFYANKRRRRKK